MRTTTITALAAAFAAGAFGLPGPAAATMPVPDTGGHDRLHARVERVREATAQFRRPAPARAAGYALLRDADGISCIDDPAGGMGFHLVNGMRVGDARARATRPEALVYEPGAHGARLVAVEYVVFRKAWRAEHAHGRPHLFGRTFELQNRDNRYGLPPFYELHLWAWKHNPAGRFDDWNPRVHCPPAP